MAYVVDGNHPGHRIILDAIPGARNPFNLGMFAVEDLGDDAIQVDFRDGRFGVMNEGFVRMTFGLRWELRK